MDQTRSQKTNSDDDLKVSFDKHFISNLNVIHKSLENEVKCPSKIVFSKFSHSIVPCDAAAYDEPCDQTLGTKIRRFSSPLKLLRIKDLVEAKSGCQFNSCLVKKDGHVLDGIVKGDERRLVENHPISYVHFGETVTLTFSKSGCRKVTFNLNSGSLLIIHSPIHEHWDREMPKGPEVKGLSLTFRRIYE